ncbi:MAG: type II secretion system protein GspG [Planctomycetes bacterium]|nr:type II secretion system protein GspG [Planctomycetota bacterium]
MKECCETGEPKKRYWHWVALGVVVLIAGALQMIPSRVPQHGVSSRTRSMADVSTIIQSLTEYSINNNDAYPTSLTPLVTPDANGHCYLEGYNGRIPKDPWKREYQYAPPTPEHPLPRVWSYGADGKPGGEGDDADIDSDQLLDER